MTETTTKDGVQEFRLDSWREFFDLTVDVLANKPAFIYRGQANYNWPLYSTIDRLQIRYPKRKNLTGNTPQHFNRPPLLEDEHLDAFRRAIRGRRGSNSPSLSSDEIWALGQHHGLATPLLDWTRSPWVALFFAFDEERCFLEADQWGPPDERGVFAVSTHTIQSNDGEKASSVRIVSPESDGNYRLVSQGGLLLRLPRKTDLERHVKERFSGRSHDAVFIKIRVKNVDRDACLVALNKMNINRMTLFPDIDGAAKYVNSLWCEGHEDSIAYV